MSLQASVSTFSEHWHRVADQEFSLRPTVRINRQTFRSEKWFVLNDPHNNEFFRISPAAYDFVARLAPGRTVEQAWEACLERDPENAPGQEEVIQLLAQLYQSNLLRGALPPDSASLFERYRKRRRLQTRSALANFMFARFPLLDPDRFLVRALPFVRPLMGRFGAVVWVAAVGLALKIAIEHWTALTQQAEGLLAPENLFLLYAGTFLVKALHELGHAFTCRRFGGAVHRLGLMLMIFTPLPFVDATSSWGFPRRRERILVASAGMIVELFLASIAMFVWAGTGPGALHSLAYNIVFMASVTTLIFNANPLLRYDGYYILCDLLGVANLSSRSLQMLRYGAERWLYGVRQTANPAHSCLEAILLAVYVVASTAYRLFVTASIIWFVSGKFLLLGLIFAAAFFVQSLIIPVVRFIAYLAHAPILDRTRSRAIAVTLAIAASAALLLGAVPFPQHAAAPGIIEAEKCTEIFAGASGLAQAPLVKSGERISMGQPLLRLVNRDLELEMEAAQAERRQALADHDRAMDRANEELKTIARRLEAVSRRITEIRTQIDALVIAAPHEGVWVAANFDRTENRWLRRGDPAGWLIDASSFHFSAVVAQEDAAALFNREIRGAKVRIKGEADRDLAVSAWRVIPGEQDLLPSPALGWSGGGNIPLRKGDRTGRRAAVAFYEVRAELAGSAGAELLHGRLGKIRFTLPPSPLLNQWLRRLAQLVQERSAL